MTESLNSSAVIKMPNIYSTPYDDYGRWLADELAKKVEQIDALKKLDELLQDGRQKKLFPDQIPVG